MRTIPPEEVVRRIQVENPWWDGGRGRADFEGLNRRAYFDLLFPLVTDQSIRRAVLLMGPRRVGKTVLIHHVIQQLILDGVPPKRICYLSVDHPLYNECGLEELLAFFKRATGFDDQDAPAYIFFDEIQYLRDWEVHLKALVDGAPALRILASGSAAAALKLKSLESGAGRFTDFLLPPLTFYEYLALLGQDNLVEVSHADAIRTFTVVDISALNAAFVTYLNVGGYPEVIFSETIQRDLPRFIKSDIIDKVLLRDLPSLYGIQDIKELNALFTSLAYNTANEVSLEGLSRNSGVAKNTIKRYLEYLEAAFLIRAVHRIDRAGKRFQRANFFKVYLTNPSMRTALFSPTAADDREMGEMAETGVFSQWFHGDAQLSYARWPDGEVDIVGMNGGKASWAVEVKWTDRFVDRPDDLTPLVEFCKANGLSAARVTTRTKDGRHTIDGVDITFVPVSVYCFALGYNIIHGKRGSVRTAIAGDVKLPGM